jgi:16S rRNA (guanine(966)-N(2))-methyltransferase RsmD
MPIRVIAGSAKGKKLKQVPGSSTRPVTDRVKEAFFNIIKLDLPDCNFLDLFAGTGSVGIEAISQGAAFARFIELGRKAHRTVLENLELTGLSGKAEVLRMDAFAFFSRRPDVHFDYVYIAPPQYKGMWITALEGLDENPDWMVSDGWIIVQIDPREYEPVQMRNFDEFDQRKYGNTLLVFYERGEEDG